MVTVLETGECAIDNSIFGVCRKPLVSERLIWAVNQSNILFRDEEIFVELPTPDFLSSLFLENINNSILLAAKSHRTKIVY